MPVVTIDGQTVFICRVSPGPKCRECRKLARDRKAVAYCDGPPPATSRKSTCSAPICREHATTVGEFDYCPACATPKQIAATPASQTNLFDVASSGAGSTS